MYDIRNRAVYLAIAVLLAVAPFAILPAAAADRDAARGGELAQQWCSECHAIGDGTQTKDTAPPFPSIANKRDDGYLRAFLANPHGPMEGFDLPRQEIDNLVAYIGSLRQK